MSFPRYPKYKDTGVEWLREVPEHWNLTPLKHIATLKSGGTPSKENTSYWEGDVPWASSKDLKSEWLSDTQDHIAAKAIDDGVAEFVPVNSVLVVVRGMILLHSFPVTRITRPMTINQDLKAVIPKPQVSSDFLAWLLRGSIEETFARIDEAAHGTKVLRMDWWTAMLLPIPLPPEQIAIAAFLDRETAKIDGLVAEQRRLIELLKENRQAVISHAVTKGLNPNAPMKPSGIEWLGDIPKHWRAVAFKNLAAPGIKTFTDGDWIEAPYITTEGVRLLQTGNVGIGSYKEQGFRFVSNETFEQLGCTEVKPRDVLICRLDGPVGRACLAPDLGVRMITSVDNAILKCAADVEPEFVVALLSSVPWISWIDALCRVGGGFRLRISRSQLGEIRVPLPAVQEQRTIARYLIAEAANWDTLTGEAERAIGLLQERRTALISAAVTGKIDVRGLAAMEAA